MKYVDEFRDGEVDRAGRSRGLTKWGCDPAAGCGDLAAQTQTVVRNFDEVR